MADTVHTYIRVYHIRTIGTRVPWYTCTGTGMHVWTTVRRHLPNLSCKIAICVRKNFHQSQGNGLLIHVIHVDIHVDKGVDKGRVDHAIVDKGVDKALSIIHVDKAPCCLSTEGTDICTYTCTIGSRYAIASDRKVRIRVAPIHTSIPWYTCRYQWYVCTSQNTRGSQCTCVPFSNQKVVT